MKIDGMSAPEVSEKLDVKTRMLYRWRKEHLAQLEGADPGKSAFNRAFNRDGLIRACVGDG